MGPDYNECLHCGRADHLPFDQQTLELAAAYRAAVQAQVLTESELETKVRIGWKLSRLTYERTRNGAAQVAVQAAANALLDHLGRNYLLAAR